MKCKIIYACISLLFICVLCYNEASAISTEDQKRIKLGIAAAQDIASVMEEMKFSVWVSGIGTAISLLLSVVSIVLDVAFGIEGDPSPEMQTLKTEFGKLNNRLDAFSVQFQEVKKQIDWSAMQLQYAKIEMTIRVFTEDRIKIYKAKSDVERNDAIQSFLFKYENNYGLATELLLNAMSTDTVLSNNLFEASRKYTDQNPELSFHFMKGCVQLLAQGYAIQATYIKLRYNSTLADEYFKKIVTFRMKSVTKKAESVYNGMESNWYNQMQLDVKRLALINQKLSHKDFADLFYNYISEKFVQRRWFVIVYDPISTWENHGSYVSGGNNFFRLAGRNINVASFCKEKDQGFTPKWANAVLDGIEVFRQDRDGAKGLLNKILSKIDKKHKVSAVTVIKKGSHVCYRSDKDRVVSKVKGVKWCNTNLCWISRTRLYDTFIFG